MFALTSRRSSSSRSSGGGRTFTCNGPQNLIHDQRSESSSASPRPQGPGNNWNQGSGRGDWRAKEKVLWGTVQVLGHRWSLQERRLGEEQPLLRMFGCGPFEAGLPGQEMGLGHEQDNVPRCPSLRSRRMDGLLVKALAQAVKGLTGLRGGGVPGGHRSDSQHCTTEFGGHGWRNT